MTLRADQREWESLASEDAFWAVYSDPSRRGSWDPEEFFATGEQEVSGIIGGLESAGLMSRRVRALDFGCGVGRLTRALSCRFEKVVGVDIAPAMVRRASELNGHLTNCEFLVSSRAGLDQFDDDRFDLVLSLIALQHVSSKRIIREYLRAFVRVTAPGGTLAFQLPIHVGAQIRLHPLRLLNRCLRGLHVTPRALMRLLAPYSMSLVALREDDVRATLEEAGALVVTAFPDRRVGTDAAPSLFYVAQVKRRD